MITTHGWWCPAQQQTQISLLRIGISHTKHPEPDLHPDFNCANHPPRRLSLLLSVKHHQFAHSNTKHIHVSHRTQVSPWALPIPRETERVTLSYSLPPKNPQKHLVCEQLISKLAFFLSKRLPAELKNYLTLFHSTSPGSTIFLLIY